MRPAVLAFPASQLLWAAATKRSTLSVRQLLESPAKGVFVRWSSQLISRQGTLGMERTCLSYGWRASNTFGSGKAYYARGSKFDPSIIQQRRAAELEEEERLRIELHPSKLLQKGAPGTVQAIIKDVIPVGYFLTLPNGKEVYLPYTELGCSGGVVLLERLYKVGQELTIKVIKNTQGGRDLARIKPDPTDLPPGSAPAGGPGQAPGLGGAPGPR